MKENLSTTNPANRPSRTKGSLVLLLFQFFGIFLLIPFVGRIVLSIRWHDRLNDDYGLLFQAFVYGLRLDIIVACIFLILPTVFLCLAPKVSSYALKKTLLIYILVVAAILIFIEVATFPFVSEYDVRPNALFLDYLNYPKEILVTIWATEKFYFGIAVFLISASSFGVLRFPFFENLDRNNSPYLARAFLFIPITLMLAIGIRGSFGHRPANPSDAIISNSKVINEITKNSFHNVAYLAYSKAKNEFDSERYGDITQKEALSRFYRLTQNVNSENTNSLRHYKEPKFETYNNKNLVIFIQESLGAQYVGALGGEKGLTPNLDRLSKEGIFFENAYASDTRSINGIAGLVAGFPPLQGEGVVKRGKAQQEFFTVAKLLKPRGFHSSFFYGGESRFDNMKSWFSGNGFDQIFEQSNYTNPVFESTRGVSDLDLVIKADDYFTKWNNTKSPFVSILFSSTNHSPFEFPTGIIDPIEGVSINHEKNTIKFADHAIGELIKMAKENNYYKDTIFAIVADHNIRVYGDDNIPIQMYKIPALILGGDIKPDRVERRVSQPDILATLIDILGVSSMNPILGHSIYRAPESTYSYFKYHDTFGLRKDNTIAILQPNRKAATFLLDDADNLIPTDFDHELSQDALAMMVSLEVIYESNLYR